MLFFAALSAWAATPIDARFRPAESPEQVRAILGDTVDGAVEQLPWAVRGIARPRLERGVTACPYYHFLINAPSFRVNCRGRNNFAWTIGKKGSFTDSDGDAHHVDLTEHNRVYDLRVDGALGEKHWRYDLSVDGKLTVTQEVVSQFLREPLRWTLHYLRD